MLEQSVLPKNTTQGSHPIIIRQRLKFGSRNILSRERFICLKKQKRLKMLRVLIHFKLHEKSAI